MRRKLPVPFILALFVLPTTFALPAWAQSIPPTTNPVQHSNFGRNALWVILVLAVLTLGGIVWRLWSTGKAREDRETRIKDIKARHADSKRAYEAMTNDATPAHELIDAWVFGLDSLAESALSNAAYSLRNAVNYGKQAVDAADEEIGEAETDAQFNRIERYLENIDVRVTEGKQTLNRIGPRLAQMRTALSKFTEKLDGIKDFETTIENQFPESEKAGFTVGDFRAKLQKIRDQRQAVEAEHGHHPTFESMRALEEITASLQAVWDDLDKLPSLPVTLAAEADRLAGLWDTRWLEVRHASLRVHELGRQWHEWDLRSVEYDHQTATRCLVEAKNAIELARVNATMEVQDFTAAQSNLATAAAKIDEAFEFKQTIYLREAELGVLKTQLPQVLLDITARARQLVDFISLHHTELDPWEGAQATRLLDQVQELTDGLAAKTNGYLRVEEQSQWLDNRIKDRRQAVREQVSMREDLRACNDRERALARTSLQTLKSVRGWDPETYAAVLALFAADLADSTLELQILHWQDARRAADEAFDKCDAAREAALRSVSANKPAEPVSNPTLWEAVTVITSGDKTSAT